MPAVYGLTLAEPPEPGIARIAVYERCMYVDSMIQIFHSVRIRAFQQRKARMKTKADVAT